MEFNEQGFYVVNPYDGLRFSVVKIDKIIEEMKNGLPRKQVEAKLKEIYDRLYTTYFVNYADSNEKLADVF